MEQYVWEFFLAHASADTDAAETLYELLRPRFRVFLDSRSLLPGDDWDQVIARAQAQSAVTLVLLSSKTEKAYYQREEIAAAIDMARADHRKHRVVPVYIGGFEAVGVSLPYGLRLKHGISIPDATRLAEVADKLKHDLRSWLVMSPEEIIRRYHEKVLIQRAVRLIPKADFNPNRLLGPAERKYVFIGDYDEQRNRTLRQILQNLMVGDAFERVANSNVEWIAFTFEIGELNSRKLDLKPATWKAAFRILSDPKRAGCFQASPEERAKLGIPPRDYYSDDQHYWYDRLTISERRYTPAGREPIEEVLGFFWTCFDGSGIYPLRPFIKNGSARRRQFGDDNTVESLLCKKHSCH